MEIQEIDITKSEIMGIYLSELFSLAYSIKKGCEEIFEETKVPDKGYIIQVSSEIHNKINNIIINAANIKKLIKSPLPRQKKESAKNFKIRKQRESVFQEILSGLDLIEIFNTDVRNKLEHFEEYLDSMALKLMDSESDIQKGYPAASYNMVFSHWEVTNPSVYPIRLYITSEKTFYHMKWSVNIKNLYDEATRIIERLEESKLNLDQDKPGGLLIQFEN